MKNLLQSARLFMCLILTLGSSANFIMAQVSTLQNWTNIYHGTSTNQQNVNYTVPTGSNSNRVLVVAIASSQSDQDARTVSVLSYGGQTLTLATGDMGSNLQQHSALYYLNEAGLDAASSATLSVQVTGDNTWYTDVWAAVFDYVNQASPLTDNKNYNSGTSAVTSFSFSSSLTVNTNNRAVEVVSCVRSGSSSLRTINYATNWSNINEQTATYGGSGTDYAIRNGVCNRTIPTTNITDASSTSFSGSALASMTALSLNYQAPPAPSITCPPAVTNFVNPVNGLVHAYPFNEGSGTVAHDIIGYQDGILMSGANWTTSGKYGDAVIFDGNDDYVDLPDDIVNGLTDFSISAWVYLNNATDTWSRIFDFGTGTGVNMFLTPRNGATNVIRFAITTTGNTGEQIINGSAFLSVNTWHQVVVTLSGNTGTLYVNGSSVGTNNSMTLNPSSLGNTNQNYISESQYTADPSLDGRIDEFRIYNRALSSSEITKLYNATVCIAYADYGPTLGNPTVTGGYLPVTVNNDAAFPLSLGINTITWTAVDVLSQTASCTQSVTVISPTVTFTGILADQCISNTTYALTGGSPAGGTYGGNGVSGTNFNASAAGVGTHIITYTYTYVYVDGTSCPGTATNTITVRALPTFTSVINQNVSCYGGNDGSIAVTITGGVDNSPYYFSIDNGTDTYNQTYTGSYPNYIITNLFANPAHKVRIKDKYGCESTICP